jgi:hypothetical protein
MRKVSLASEVGKHVEFSSEFKIRDEKALKRVTSGLIKLLFPDEQFDNSELKQVAELALEYRRKVRDWLHKLSPSELTQNIVRKAIEDFKKWLESEKLLVLNSSPALSAFPRSALTGLSRSPWGLDGRSWPPFSPRFGPRPLLC